MGELVASKPKGSVLRYPHTRGGEWQNNTGKVTFQPCPSFVSGKLGDPDGGRPRLDLVRRYFSIEGT